MAEVIIDLPEADFARFQQVLFDNHFKLVTDDCEIPEWKQQEVLERVEMHEPESGVPWVEVRLKRIRK